MRKNGNLMKRKFIYAILGVLVLYIVFGNSLIRSEENIREDLLESTPIGTPMNDVIKYVKSNQEWEIDDISYDHGYFKSDDFPRRTIGEKSIRVEIGEYRLIFVTSVTVFWGFDENSKLVDIWVWKTTDAL